MIGFKLDQAKSLFFDSSRVMAATTKAERRVLSRYGAFVRTRARSSIRSRNRVSTPGQPPSGHGAQHLKRFILFVFDAPRRSVVIGPARLNAKIGMAPEALEHGGLSETLTGPRRERTKKQVYVRARPFMGPAAEAEQSKLPSLWRDSIR